MNAGYFRQLAHYNAWANRRIYTAAAELSDGERKAKRPSFFGSIHATLNHILVGDRVWLCRLMAKPLGRIVSKPDGITGLDQELYADFDALQAARLCEDERLIAVIESFRETDLADDLTYRSMAGQDRRSSMVQVLGHMFNHQTHHRGQVHGLLSATTVAPPSLDMIQFAWAEPAIQGR
jgi:uncharacterized damage-inducible protein DinB